MGRWSNRYTRRVVRIRRRDRGGLVGRLVSVAALVAALAGVYLIARAIQATGAATTHTGGGLTTVSYDPWNWDHWETWNETEQEEAMNENTAALPRGIRNHNPGNIEYTGTAWKGLDSPPTDGRYCRFIDPVWGIRAMARILLNYQRLYGIDTVAGIVSRWAPSSENDTGAYIASVAGRVGVAPDETISVEGRLYELIPAMIYHENGQQPYSAGQIREGVSLA